MSNKDEALRARDVAEDWMSKADFTAARRFATKAQKMDASLENVVSRMIMVCDVHCAALEKSGDETDWYKILKVEQNADDNAIKKQYRKLALHLHPDKNTLPGAESAFKIIGEAQRVLLDKDKRRLHDLRRKPVFRRPAPAPSFKPQQAPTTPVFTQRFQTNGTQPFEMNVNATRKMPENQKKPQAQPTGFGGGSTFRTSCAFQETFQVPPVQTTFQQNNVPTQEAAKAAEKKPENSAKSSSTKEGFRAKSSGTSAVNNNGNGKRKIETIDVVSISSDSEEVPASGQHSRRSVRSKQQVSYKENKSDDDNKEEDAESESVFRKKSHHDQLFAETLPNDINRTKKIKENQVGSSRDSGARNVAKDSSSGSSKRKLNFGKKKADESQNSKRTEEMLIIPRNSKDVCSASRAGFKIIVQQTGLYSLVIPGFVAKYLPRKNTTFKIHHPDGKRSWDVDYVAEHPKYRFSRGWTKVYKAYSIDVGDSCTFSVIKGKRNELRLTISKP